MMPKARDKKVKHLTVTFLWFRKINKLLTRRMPIKIFNPRLSCNRIITKFLVCKKLRFKIGELIIEVTPIRVAEAACYMEERQIMLA